MIKFGIEIEKFITNKNNNLVIVPENIPMDEEGLQIEARGRPNADIYQAVFSAVGHLEKIQHKLQTQHGLLTIDEPFTKIDKELKLKLRRMYHKGVIRYQNIYGHIKHSVPQNVSTAGIHVSITNEKTFHYNQNTKNPQTFTYNAPVDFVHFIRYLDKHFDNEIKWAKRKPGFYEIKSNGRIEYRSLPTNVDLLKLCKIISKYEFKE